MKKFAAVSLSLLMMITSVFADTNVSVMLNNEEVSFANQQPVIVEGRTLIPLRSIFENLGYTIEWQADTKTAILNSDKATVTIAVNANDFDVSGTIFTLDTPAQIINGSMMLPLRAIGEATGLTVSWNNETKVVSLGSAAEENAAIQEDSEAKKEMADFYNKSSSLISVIKCYEDIDDVLTRELGDISVAMDNKALAATKGAEKTKNLITYFENVYKNVEVWKVPEECKAAKSSLLECINDNKKLAEIYNNMFNDVYPDYESMEKDLTAVLDDNSINSATVESEIAKLNNQYNRVMYKYFDTEKDTEENQEKIKSFTEEIGKIDEKYPIPALSDICDEDNNIIIDNIDDNIAKINSAAEGREAEFNNVNTPDNCNERIELIKLSNNILKDLTEALNKYKNFGADKFNPYEIDVFKAIVFYDYVSTLAADEELTLFNENDGETFDFETYADDEYRTIDMGDISQETQDFVNNYYNANSIANFMQINDGYNDMFGLTLAFDEDSTKTGKDAKSFFANWSEAQNDLFNQLKSFIVSEPLMALKSAAINYIDLDIQYTRLMQSYYEKKITEEQYDKQAEELDNKLSSADDAFISEKQRVESQLDDYMYDYLDFDMARTEITEADEFGKKILEINEKYPVLPNDYYSLFPDDKTSLDSKDIQKIKNKIAETVTNIEKREAEYEEVEVPQSCEKRYELLLAADKMLLDYYENADLTADDKYHYSALVMSMSNASVCYKDLVYIATNGAELEEE